MTSTSGWGAGSSARAGPSTRCSPPTGRRAGRLAPRRPRPPGVSGAEPEQLGLLAEAIFAYIDELSADSVEGYAQAQREQEGERQRRRRELLALLLRDPPAAEEPRSAPPRRRRAGGCPARSAPLAVAEADLARLARRLSADALVASVGGIGCALVPCGRAEAELERATEKLTAALGPAVPRAELAGAWSLAAAALRAVRRARSMRQA